MVSLSWRLAKSGAQLLSTRRLQPQLRLLVCVALVAALWPLYRRGLQAGNVAPAAIDPAFALVWLVGIACALGAAYQAKFHRLAALILMGGAGLATCITFAWLSAPDLALTQLLVEIVTTVLLLLGLRWLPKRLEIDLARQRAGGGPLAAPARSRHCGRRGRRNVDGRLRRHDATAARRHLAILRRARLYRGRRHQHRQRHPGRLPRLRHAGRDHRARRSWR